MLKGSIAAVVVAALVIGIGWWCGAPLDQRDSGNFPTLIAALAAGWAAFIVAATCPED